VEGPNIREASVWPSILHSHVCTWRDPRAYRKPLPELDCRSCRSRSEAYSVLNHKQAQTIQPIDLPNTPFWQPEHEIQARPSPSPRYLDRTETECFGKSIRCWNLNNPRRESFTIARRSMLNVIECRGHHVRTRLEHDLARFEKANEFEPPGASDTSCE
jgi:hypothetical protein